MRVALVYASAGESRAASPIVEALAGALRARGYQTERIEAKSGEAHRLSGFDYIIVGTEPVGIRGRLPRQLADFLAQAGSVQGRRSMAFVRRRGISSAKALKRLMSTMETEGMMVNFAMIVAGTDDAVRAAGEAPIERN
ncbi:MAG TPA: hypothetical protein VMC79_06970 [Rectinemataceae bacterium]|nr:hypothetical protein [Rectinemataceae bacterium]